MRWPPILAILCLLAGLLVPRIASTSTAAGAETRVWAFHLAEQVRVGVERSLTLTGSSKGSRTQIPCASLVRSMELAPF